MKKPILIALVAFGILVIANVMVLLIMVGLGPETYVVPGRQVPARYLSRMRSLDLLEEGEKVAYFYSDALTDIRKGLYFVSDRKVTAYCDSWDPPAVKVPFGEIIDLSVDYNESFWDDSTIWIRAKNDVELAIPVSSEKGGDKNFFEYLERKCGKQKAARPADSEGGK
jgi:hypothetical protein